MFIGVHLNTFLNFWVTHTERVAKTCSSRAYCTHQKVNHQ